MTPDQRWHLGTCRTAFAFALRRAALGEPHAWDALAATAQALSDAEERAGLAPGTAGVPAGTLWITRDRPDPGRKTT